ncbi:unnamed protein product [Ilex paraguariensis]|uniref:peroxidase n=1 Tax=Ilex paraguariensis TaxID=185542 RepID=A0ABC8SQE8_9AQUA
MASASLSAPRPPSSWLAPVLYLVPIFWLSPLATSSICLAVHTIKSGSAGLVSQATHVERNLARANTSMNKMITLFKSKGFNVQEMVALTGGGHTVGFAHCKEFSNRIFGYSKTSEVDPALNPMLADALRKVCANYTTDQSMSAFLDASDHALVSDPRTKPLVDKYAGDQAAFFRDFAHAMEKLSVYGIKTGHKGEVRHRCDAFNSIKI